MNESLPQEKVSIDEALLLTPPVGMEFGYVPVPLYQRKKVRPIDCEVVVGAYEDEPEPIVSTNYYSGHDELYFDREELQCTGPEVDGMTYPGLIFPNPPDPSAGRLQYAYSVPLPDLTVLDTEMVPFNNPRIELDDSVPTNGGDTGGDDTGEDTPVCSNASLRFKVKKSDGRKIMRDCDWVSTKPGNRCKFDGISSACPFSCGTCDVCEDSTLRFKITKSDNRKIMRDCDWVTTNSENRCTFNGVSDACRVACGNC
mmetsp:Transcript_12794/g.15662  ORF Transcript_12794/g.15662 Transcript_12794/m.15662 type:complete len:256 (+) Transcript_12794:1877-2644(+)